MRLKNECNICNYKVIDNEQPNGWTGGVVMYIDYIDKEITLCNSCWGMLCNESNITKFLVNENGKMKIDRGFKQ